MSSDYAAENDDSADRAHDLQNHIISIYFLCNEGSVTHYFHFLFGGLIPLIEYHLTNNKRNSYRIKTDIGPMKCILCELPLNIVEICGPSASGRFKAHDDKSVYTGISLKIGDIRLPAYDSFDQIIYDDSYSTKFSMKCRDKICTFFYDNLPSYIATIPTYKIILIERKTDKYYQQIKQQNRTDIYSTSGAERR